MNFATEAVLASLARPVAFDAGSGAKRQVQKRKRWHCKGEMLGTDIQMLTFVSCSFGLNGCFILFIHAY